MFTFTMACKWHTSSSLHAQCCVVDKCFHYSTHVQVVVRFVSSVLHVSPLLSTAPLNTVALCCLQNGEIVALSLQSLLR